MQCPVGMAALPGQRLRCWCLLDFQLVCAREPFQPLGEFSLMEVTLDCCCVSSSRAGVEVACSDCFRSWSVELLSQQRRMLCSL